MQWINQILNLSGYGCDGWLYFHDTHNCCKIGSNGFGIYVWSHGLVCPNDLFENFLILNP